MSKNYLKAFVLFIIILITSSSIISSESNLVNQCQRNSLIISETEINIRTLNPKIIAAIQMVNESLLREFLKVLTVEIGPRFTGTYGCEEAAKYIFEQFENMGLETRYYNWEARNDRIPFHNFKSQNVEATHYGKDESCNEILIFNAHYDGIKDSPAAIDDGSGTVAVLTAAYVLSQFEFNRTIKFITFSGEEVGLLGSKVYANELYENDVEILVDFNADMIGYAGTAYEGGIVNMSSTEDAIWITNEIKDINQKYGIVREVNRNWEISPDRSRGGSDYYDFVLNGYEAVSFWQSGRYEYWHTPEDTFDKVNFSYLTNMTRLIVASLAHMADIEVYYPQIRIGAPRRGRLYYEDRTIKHYKYHKICVIDDILICTEVKPGDKPIEKVEFYYDDELQFTDTEEPYQWRLNELSITKHKIEVILYDEEERTARDQINFRFINLLKDR